MQKVDPLFGLMKFCRSFGFFGAGYWEGVIKFSPLGKSIKISAVAGRRGVLETQREFYRELEKRYVQMIDAIADVLIDTPFNYLEEKYFDSKPKWEDFELDYIFLPSFKKPELEWGLSYLYFQ